MPEVRREIAPYVQIAQHFRDLIQSGTLAPGDRLPSARDIAAEWRISRATADKAVSALRSEGLVIALTGVGTVVANHNRATVQTGGTRFRRMLVTGRATKEGERSEILSSGLAPAPTHVAAFLRIAEGANVVKRQRRFTDEDGIAAVSTSWIPAELAEAVPALLETASIPGGTIGAIRAATGRQPAPGTDTAIARLATGDEAEALGLIEPVAVLVVQARLCDEDGEPMEIGEDVIGPNRPWTVGYDLSLI
jgi:GntR family transcriptional regulator